MGCNLEDDNRLMHIEDLHRRLREAMDNSYDGAGGHPRASRRDSPQFRKVVGDDVDAVLAVNDGPVKCHDGMSDGGPIGDGGLQAVDRVGGSKLEL